MKPHAKSRLVPLIFQPLPLASIRPSGWLLNQLRIQADGLSGHLDEFWPDLAENAWVGGQTGAYDRGPYWLDGIIPLAFLLGEERLKTKVQRWVDYILTHQHENGWLGPLQDPSGAFAPDDPWPVFVALKALTQFHEATGDGRVIRCLEKFFHRLDQVLDERALAEFAPNEWGLYRWADLVLSLHWLYERTQDTGLLELAAKVRRQGYDWRSHFEQFRHQEKTKRDECTQRTHVVNNAMGLKQPAVWFRQSHDERDGAAVFNMIETLDRYHGQATGVFTGDEHYAGLNPSQGTELCSVVEYMFSLETLLTIIGAPRFGDRLERIAFNALPAAFKPDMWAHQYDQQANQVLCAAAQDCIYTNNGPDSNIFGLQPNFPCCTANMHQGWPKFASHLWMTTADGGLVAVAYAPSTVTTQINGSTVAIQLETNYPFSERLQFTVHVSRPVRFPLGLRIPGWAEGAAVRISGEEPVPPKTGTFHWIEREWNSSSAVTLHLPMRVSLQRRYHHCVSVERGPLVYSLKIGEDWKLIRGEPPHGDWEVHPTTPWNYALALDTDHPEASIQFEERGLGDCPFSPDGAPVVARANGRRVPEWTIEHQAAGPLPFSPVSSAEPLEELTLIPYGCTNLRITEFPILGVGTG